MAEFFDSEDDYGDMFITQSGEDMGRVSLEENCEEKVLKQAEYSDISDFEDDGEMEQRLRFVRDYCNMMLCFGFDL